MKKQHILAVFLLTFLFAGFSPVSTSAQVAVCIDLKSGLNIGSKNSSVVQLQDFLRAQGLLSSISTGYFGPLTFSAVKAFQTKQNISAVGNVGPLTRAEIKKVSCVTLPVTQPVSTTTSTTTEATATTSGQVLGAQTNKVSLPYNRVDSFVGWEGTWGSVSTTSTGSLMVKASTTTEGASAFFPNSVDWTDYRYTASVSISNGDVKLIARRVDDNNYIACVFDGNWIGIKQRINGHTSTVAEISISELSSAPFFQRGITVAMRVKGNEVGCTTLGTEDNVTFKNVDSKLLKGAIGVETDFEAKGASTLELRQVRVEAI